MQSWQCNRFDRKDTSTAFIPYKHVNHDAGGCGSGRIVITLIELVTDNSCFDYSNSILPMHGHTSSIKLYHYMYLVLLDSL